MLELSEKMKRKRDLRLSFFNEKTNAILEYLDSHAIRYRCATILKEKGTKENIHTDIYVPKYKIAIRMCINHSKVDEIICQRFFHLMKERYYPIFIRLEDTKEFVVTKLIATIEKAIASPKEGFDAYKKNKVKVKKNVLRNSNQIGQRTGQWKSKNR